MIRSRFIIGLLLALLLTFVVRGTLARTARNLDLLVDVRYEILEQFVDDINEDDLAEAAVRGMIASLNDQHTAFLLPKDLEDMDEQVRGQFTGIGAEITIDDQADRLKIVTPLEDSPAWRNGVMAGDAILAIDGVSTRDIFKDMTTSSEKLGAAVNRLTGEEHTQVEIHVRHETGEEETITITREVINVRSVRGFRRNDSNQWQYMLDPIQKIGYIKIRQFSERTAGEMREALATLQTQEPRGLILDLRFNPGGVLPAPVAVSDMFLPVGQMIVSVKRRTGLAREYKSQTEPIFPSVPIVVLANEFSASAAEIVTGALTDNGRALFVGMRTYGKGSVQQVRLLEEEKSALRITIAYYYLPSGRLIHRRRKAETWGVDPEDGFFVPMTPQQIRQMQQVRLDNTILRRHENETISPQWIEDNLADLQLAAGLEAIVGKLATNNWPQVGQSGADQILRNTRRQTLIRHRDLLMERLEQTETELAELDDPEGDEEIVPELVDEASPISGQSLESRESTETPNPPTLISPTP